MASESYDPDNIFARILRGDLPAHRVFEDEHVIAIMDVMPQGPGHTLVIPRVGSRNLLDAEPAVLAPLMEAVRRIARASVRAFQADGVTVMQFNEAPAGQSVYHLHVHVIPRFDGTPLKPHSGTMEDEGVLSAHAEKLRAALAAD